MTLHDAEPHAAEAGASSPSNDGSGGGGLPFNGKRDGKVYWAKDTDLVLRDLVLRSAEVDWSKIATAIEWDTGTVTPEACQERWAEVKETPVKGPWSSEEDDHLKRLVEEYGAKKWNLLARAFPGRSGKQCRERWHNHVDERVKKGEWTAEEDQILCEAQRQLGNKWSEMSRILAGRSENAIKNRFNSLNAKGLTETRANELMSKLDPNEAAQFLVRRRMSSSSSSSLHGGAQRSTDEAPVHDDDGDESCSSNGNDHVSSGVEGGPATEEGDGLGERDGEELRKRGGRGGGSGGGGSGGGSTALKALMVAVSDERAACVESGEDESDGRGIWGRGGSIGGSSGSGAGWSSSRGAEREEWGRSKQSRGGWVADDADRRGVKRDRGVTGRLPEAFTGGRSRKPLRRKSDMARAEEGMSVLAKAAGLLEISDDAEDDGMGSGSYSDHSGAAHAIVTYANSTRSRSNSPSEGRFDGHHHRSRAYKYNARAAPENSGPPAGYRKSRFRGVIDHGSTPPGSASPPPNGATGDAAAAAPYGGYGNQSDGRCYPVAHAFPVGAGRMVSADDNDTGANNHSSSFHRKSDRGGGGGGGGGGDHSRGGDGGGGERAPPQWTSAVSRAARDSDPSPRPGWFVGPGGVHRRSLEAVPGPWRPYWRGQDSVDMDGNLGRVTTGGFGRKRFKQRE